MRERSHAPCYKSGVWLRFISVFYLLLFSSALEYIWIGFKYFDELLILGTIAWIMIEVLQTSKIKVSKERYELYFIAFLLIGLAGNLIFGVQQVVAWLSDLLVNLKFVVGISFGYRIFKNNSIERYKKQIFLHIRVVVWLYLLLIMFDYLMGGFFTTTVRYGLRSTQLFYDVPTSFAAACGFLYVLLLLIYDQSVKMNVYLLMILLLICSTLRSKSFGVVLVYILLYYLIYCKNKKINTRYLILGGALCVWVAWPQIYFYFFSVIAETSARAQLLVKSFAIANDHFPIGTGFATFASYYSGVYYSDVYYQYGLSGIYGLQESNIAYVSDSFWPMILGQTGYSGLLLYGMMLYQVFKRIQKMVKVSKEKALAGLCSLVYLCVVSLGETAFAGSYAVMFALVIGIVFSQEQVLE